MSARGQLQTVRLTPRIVALAVCGAVALGRPVADAAPSQQAYLKASRTSPGDSFGYSVSVSGDTVVVGARREAGSTIDVNGSQKAVKATNAGAAYVFVRSGTNWTQQADLKSSSAGAGDSFGESVSISADTVVVGAPWDGSSGFHPKRNDTAPREAGSAFVFVREGTNWVEQACLKASLPRAASGFGGTVAVSGDTVIVGAYGESSSATGVNGNPGDTTVPASGAAYIFVRTGTNWTQQAYLKASNAEKEDSFGRSVAVAGDTVVVGAWWESSSANGVNGNESDNGARWAGAAYVFVRSGTNWSQQAYLKASNAGPDNYFGKCVAVSGDTVVIGAEGEDSKSTGVNGNQSNNGIGNFGAAYVFVRKETNWRQEAYLKAAKAKVNMGFGTSVAISGDMVVVGAVGEDSAATGVNGNQNDSGVPGSGAAYVFLRKGTNWSQQYFLKPSNPNGNIGSTGRGVFGRWPSPARGTYTSFGWSVAASGETVVVGAIGEASNAKGVNGNQGDNSMQGAGSAYVFGRAGH